MRYFLVLVLWVLSMPVLSAGDDEEKEKKKWSNDTELSAVRTGGNSEANSLGLVNKYSYVRGKGTFTWNVFAIRVETTNTSRSATGTVENPVFNEESESSISSENYRSEFQFDRKVAERTAWFVGLTWEQDEPQGFSDRSKVVGGVANTWIKSETRLFSTNYGVGYNEEKLVSGADDDFYTAELGYVLMAKFGNAQFDQKMNGSSNTDDSKDWRLRLDNGLSVNMHENLALKVSLNLRYSNEPNIVMLDLFLPDESGDLVNSGEKVDYELDQLDTQFTTSLVIRF